MPLGGVPLRSSMTSVSLCGIVLCQMYFRSTPVVRVIVSLFEFANNLVQRGQVSF